MCLRVVTASATCSFWIFSGGGHAPLTHPHPTPAPIHMLPAQAAPRCARRHTAHGGQLADPPGPSHPLHPRLPAQLCAGRAGAVSGVAWGGGVGWVGCQNQLRCKDGWALVRPQCQATAALHSHFPTLPHSRPHPSCSYIFNQMRTVLDKSFADESGAYSQRIAGQPELYGLVRSRMAQYADYLRPQTEEEAAAEAAAVHKSSSRRKSNRLGTP